MITRGIMFTLNDLVENQGPFVLPIHYDLYGQMPIIDRSQLVTANFLIANLVSETLTHGVDSTMQFKTYMDGHCQVLEIYGDRPVDEVQIMQLNQNYASGTQRSTQPSMGGSLMIGYWSHKLGATIITELIQHDTYATKSTLRIPVLNPNAE